MKLLIPFIAVLACAAAEAPQRHRLQILNASDQAAEVFEIQGDTGRVQRGTVEAGRDLTITTTPGRRFVVVGRGGGSEATVTCEVPVQAFRFAPGDRDGIPAFYTQRASAGGLPIVASAKVSPFALKEAVFLVDLMLAKRPDVRSAMIKSGSRLCIMAHDEFTTDLPEFARLADGAVPEKSFAGSSAKDFWDTRARGLGGSTSDPYCSCAEENLLGFPGDPYAAESILIHEFSHNMHLRGLVNTDATFDPRLKAAYDAAMKAGLWKGKYAAGNHHEYFAEGVQSWFDNNRENDHDHNHVNTRAELLEYDPGLAAMCREVFGDTELRYTKPATRLTGHMAGYDPAKAPKFAWPARLVNLKQRIREKAQERERLANSHDTRVIAGWKVHVKSELLARDPAATGRALELLTAMLDEIVRVVPGPAVAKLREVPLFFSPEYPGTGARAEYHPEAAWLRVNGRDPAMAKAVEFTNIRVFEAEVRRMPNFALHELAHAFHDRILGFGEPRIMAAYEKAKASGKYEAVKIRNGDGREHTGRAYTISNHKEYFAETTEAFFSRNDIFPFVRDELKAHDPGIAALLADVWGVGK